jgi:hypothetical protein
MEVRSKSFVFNTFKDDAFTSKRPQMLTAHRIHRGGSGWMDRGDS